MNDSHIVDSVGEIGEGRVLVYTLFNFNSRVFVQVPADARGFGYCFSIGKAYRFDSRADAERCRLSTAQPQLWNIVPAVYDAIDDTVTPVGG